MCELFDVAVFVVAIDVVQAGPLVGYFIGYYVLHLHLQDYQPCALNT